MSRDYEKTMKFLETVQYMTVAVVDLAGKPWAVPVRMQRREGMSFYWDSSPEALHSRSIEANPNVMLMLYRAANEAEQEFGFYGDAVVRASEVLPDGRIRYRADVSQAWINDEQHQKRELALLPA